MIFLNYLKSKAPQVSQVSTQLGRSFSNIPKNFFSSTQMAANKAKGRVADNVTRTGLKTEMPDHTVLDEVSGKFSDGKRTRFDKLTLGPDGKPSSVHEVKSGDAKLTPNQLRFYEGGEQVELVGKKAGSLAGTKFTRDDVPSYVEKHLLKPRIDQQGDPPIYTKTQYGTGGKKPE